jgi:hypothetical protein
MGRAILAFSGSAAALLPQPVTDFGHKFFGAWIAVNRHLFSGYKPERHYMRGPGPAWRAKYGASRAG